MKYDEEKVLKLSNRTSKSVLPKLVEAQSAESGDNVPVINKMSLQSIPMRKFYIRPGSRYAGEYPIYESEKEFREVFPDEYLFRWHRDDYHKLVSGMYAEAEDGYIMECLNAYKLVNKGGQTTYCYRMVNYLATVYIRKTDGVAKWSKWLGNISKIDGGSLADNSIDRQKELKIKFAAFVIAGLPIRQAFNLASVQNGILKPVSNNNKIISLMSDKVVLNQMREHLQIIKDGIDNRFNTQRLIQELDDLITMSTKGSDAHRKNIQFILELKGILDKRAKHEIEDAEYKDETPPFDDTKK